MNNHAAVEKVIDRIVRDVIGGAVDTAKEVMDALAEVAESSQAKNTQDLFREMDQAVTAVLKICPSFAPPINVMHLMLGTLERDMEAGLPVENAIGNLLASRETFHHSVDTALDKIAGYGAELIHDGDIVFMFSMSSTTWKVLRKAGEQGKKFTLLVTEARPANEGLWTVDEMCKSGIPVEIGIDACVAEMVVRSDIAFAGVDAVAADGSVFNKSGTFLAALTAREYGVPFYFATDTLKFDTSTLLGMPFRNEAVATRDVLGDKHYQSGVKVSGNLFDITPARLITALVTELGVIPPAACVNVMWNMKLSQRISGLLPAWVDGKL